MNTTTIMVNLVYPGIGVLAGLLASLAYFKHLENEVDKLVNGDLNYSGLLLGASMRIGVLLALAWLILNVAGPWSAAGYALAFLLIRSISIRRKSGKHMRVKTKQVQSCN